ncbi:MAG: lipoprotein signal peptidase [Dysgonamonadaceae bacterium]|jgi:signal peptidase II|nr:lipoprotein signal peptidase [Dysgonamonadaceae bacterium]
MSLSKKGFWAIAVIVLILTVDQIIKIWVKTNMCIAAELSTNVHINDIRIADWFYIRFVENSGMAMGIQVIGKLFLSLFRIVASFAIAYYIYRLIKRDFRLSYILFVSMIFAGAVGNIVDSIFYGVIFSESTPMQTAVLFPPDGGYGTWLHGKVVDMFYFPLFSFTWPSWIPFLGGSEFEFFKYIFNFADASISVGGVILFLFYRKTFSLSFENKKDSED